MTERKLQRNRRGFTLTEVLLALAILIILLALAMIPISRHQRDIRQSELDSKAETIYLAAQNRLSQLQASGRSDRVRQGPGHGPEQHPLGRRAG